VQDVEVCKTVYLLTYINICVYICVEAFDGGVLCQGQLSAKADAVRNCVTGSKQGQTI